MSCIESPPWSTQVYHSIEHVPTQCDLMFDRAESYFSTRAWFYLLESTCAKDITQPQYLILSWQQQPVAFMALCQGAGHRGCFSSAWPLQRFLKKSISSLNNFYTVASTPLITLPAPPPSANDEASLPTSDDVLTALAKALKSYLGKGDLLSLDYLDPLLFNLPVFAQALKAQGLVCHQQVHFPVRYINQQQVTFSDAGFDQYCRNASKNIRKKYPRKARRLSREHDHQYLWLSKADEAQQAAKLFEQVYLKSWKQPERHPDFVSCFITQAMDSGHMGMAVLMIENEPAAAQIYLTYRHTVVAFKSAYDPAYKRLSPTSLLRLFAFECLFSRNTPESSSAIHELNFGYGDEAYKQDWLEHQRPLYALTAINPSSLMGWAIWFHLSFKNLKVAVMNKLKRFVKLTLRHGFSP